MNPGRFRYLFTPLRLLVSVSTYFGILCVVAAYSNPWLVQEAKIASKVEFPGECIDSHGVVRGHMENWTSYDGSCDQRICYNGILETIRWQINYDCPGMLESLLDNGNCFYVSDSELGFPTCCPYLVCNNATIETTTVPACYDEQSTVTCEFWKNLTNCEYMPDSINPYLFNYTAEFCQLTCGYC